MKTKYFVLPLFIAIVFLNACKKEEPTPIAPVATDTDKLTAVVNGVNFVSAKYGISTTSLNAGGPTYYFVSGTSDISNPQKPRIQFQFMQNQLHIGTMALSSNFSDVHAMYEENGISFNSMIGNMTISSIDTIGNNINSLVATFEFETDSISGSNIKATNGIINFK